MYDRMHPGSLQGDAEAGIRVTALDIDAGMLARLRETREDQLATLRSAHAHLRPGGDGALLPTDMMHLEPAYLYPADIAALLTESGFELQRISGDFFGRPFERDGDELVVEARKR